MKIDSERIRDCIKQSPFRLEEIAVALDISERSLYRKLRDDDLNVRELNIILQLLATNIMNFIKE